MIPPDPSNTITKPKKITTTQTARRKLELSQVTPNAIQQETMGTDVGIDKFAIYLSSVIKMDVVDRITDGHVSRTIDAASTLTVNINDYDRAVLRSGLLYNKLDVQLDGLWFRLTGVDKQDDNLTLTFEDREVAVLRTYDKWKIARRSKVTRAEFVLNLIREVKEFQIPVVIPELHTVQPMQRYDNDTVGADAILYKRKGIGPDAVGKPVPVGDPSKTFIDITRTNKLTGRDYVTLGKDQRANASKILAVGEQMRVSRKIMVCAIMTSIDESNLVNVSYGDKDSLGLFQQRASWGSVEDRMNPETSAKMFYNSAIKADARNPHLSYNDLCQAVQISGTPFAYGQYHDRADAIVSAYGVPGGLTEGTGADSNGQFQNFGAGGEFYFYRGTIENRKGQKVRKPQNSWDCIQGLAQDVNWRAFFVSGTFYFISEDDLIKQQPAMTLTEYTDGVVSINGNFYEHKKSATLEVVADVGKWLVAPGRCVVVEDMGPWDGRWLVSDFERGLFDLQATINLSRELPALPEPNPKGGNAKQINDSWIPKPQTSKAGSTDRNNPPQYGVDNVRSLASQLLKLHNKGWTDYNTGYQQMQDTAAGKQLYYPGVGAVTLDARIISVILWLITDQGFDIGTYAWCTDHTTWDGPTGHNGGHAVDIEYINGLHINNGSNQCKVNVIAVDKALNSLDGYLSPRQIISGGYGNHRDSDCSGYTRPASWVDHEYDPGVMGQHCNHIHVGY